VYWLSRVIGYNLLIRSKSDLLNEDTLSERYTGLDILYISASTHYHVYALKQRLVDKVLQGQVGGESLIVTNTRHYEALLQIASSLADIRKGMDDIIPGDLLALDIRRCLHYLGEIRGAVTKEDQLDYIFSKFCVWKRVD
jgi:tRNA modification GTPase